MYCNCVLDIYKRNLEVTHKTTLCSKATFFVVFTTILATILPFIFAYRSRGFWLKRDSFYEQPNVRFRGEYYFVGISNNVSNIIICSNINTFSQLKELDKCSTLKVREIDTNHDGKVDTFEFFLEIDYNPDGHFHFLQHVTLFLPLDYRLNAMCPLNMQSAIILQHMLIPKTNDLEIYANLKLHQQSPLLCHPKRIDKFNNHQLIEDGHVLDNLKLENLIYKYLKRNMTTHLTDIYSIHNFKSGNFKLQLRVNFIEDEIHYQPSIWQIFKWAWIQYFAIYVIFAWIIKKLQKYMFDNNLLLTYKTLPNDVLMKLTHSKKYY